MRVALAALTVGAMLAGGAVAQPAVEARQAMVIVPAGTILNLLLTTGVSSKSSAIEDRIVARLRRAIVVRGVVVAPAGAIVKGFVVESTRAGRVKGRARVGLQFTALRAVDGAHTIETEGITREATGGRGEDARTVATTGSAGTIIGTVAGGARGGAVGAAVAAAGAGVVLLTRGDDVALEPGAELTTRLTSPLVVRVPVR
jgi:hypothetical protein